jgi:hypothetical protein
MNTHEENSLNFDRNSNEIRPPHTPETKGGISQGNPHTLYNKISEKGILDGWFHYKDIIKTPHGYIWIENV